jgi:hypothetical protein
MGIVPDTGDRAVSTQRPTRGSGFLEGMLSEWRGRVLRRHIGACGSGVVVDIGCGGMPQLLLSLPAQTRIGIDQLFVAGPHERYARVQAQLKTTCAIPLRDGSADCALLLALLEHLDLAAVGHTLRETFRVLKPGGQIALTTPHALSDSLLRLMASLNMVSSQEIDEHQTRFTRRLLRRCLAGAGFGSITVGGFQLGLNIWACATRPA